MRDKLISLVEAGLSEMLANAEDSDSEESEFDSMEIDESGLPDFQRRQETRKARSKPIPIAGTKGVGQVAMFDSTGGLQWNFYNTHPN